MTVAKHDPRKRLEADHTHIEALLRATERSVRQDDIRDAECRWNELEAALLAHLDAEEMFVIPTLMLQNETEAKAILAEHAQIRCTLGDIGVAFELHTVRADAIDEFCMRLRAHAAHEEILMYPLAQTGLPPAFARSLIARLRSHAPRLKVAASR